MTTCNELKYSKPYMRLFYQIFILSFLLTAGFAQTGFSQTTIVVQGIVRDDAGQPMPAVNVVARGTTTGAVTDEAGKYILQVPANAVLIFSHQGYRSQEVIVQQSGDIDIAMVMGMSHLGEVVVTATRSERAVESIPQHVSVISREDIDKTAATDLTDLVKKTAGVDVIQYPGLLSGIGIRGFRPQFSGINQRTLVLIDGRPAGATNLATIDMNNVERVEVQKGPASALYGSQAMGGVVNIITKKTSGEVKDACLQASEILELRKAVFQLEEVSLINWTLMQASTVIVSRKISRSERITHSEMLSDGTKLIVYYGRKPVRKI